MKYCPGIVSYAEKHESHTELAHNVGRAPQSGTNAVCLEAFNSQT